MSASSCLDLNIDFDRDDETLNFENLEVGDFPVLKLYYDQQAHTRHSYQIAMPTPLFIMHASNDSADDSALLGQSQEIKKL